uniref:Uncharacterized protein n=1 Tax=Ananas comosus var. bracteatus TaxID=296719 RepID=A0A6V7QCQ6_ANACO|nr:unnamed protein product [Ananas comosus var. bracteatus]
MSSVPDEASVRQRNSGTRNQIASGARPHEGFDGERPAAGVVPNFRYSASRGVPMASGARPGARRALKNPIFDVERRVALRELSMAIGERLGQGREARAIKF